MTEMLALIELHCDAFAALTLASLGRNPLELIRSVEQSSRDFPDCRDSKHPDESQRRKVIEGILPARALSLPIQQSDAFHKLKQVLIQREVAKKNAHLTFAERRQKPSLAIASCLLLDQFEIRG